MPLRVWPRLPDGNGVEDDDDLTYSSQPRILDHFKRPVSATADATELRDISEVVVSEDLNITLKLLFDSEHNLEERILNEQFAY